MQGSSERAYKPIASAYIEDDTPLTTSSSKREAGGAAEDAVILSNVNERDIDTNENASEAETSTFTNDRDSTASRRIEDLEAAAPSASTEQDGTENPHQQAIDLEACTNTSSSFGDDVLWVGLLSSKSPNPINAVS